MSCFAFSEIQQELLWVGVPGQIQRQRVGEHQGDAQGTGLDLNGVAGFGRMNDWRRKVISADAAIKRLDDDMDKPPL